jgi:SAM-dependent methyltransferase
MSATGNLHRDHFVRRVAHWSEYGPPLRPSPDDSVVVQQCADSLPTRPVVLVLGLTPETIGCRWPTGTRLIAADHSASALGLIWPQGTPDHVVVVLARWEALPLPGESVHLVCGDGCSTGMVWPGPMQQFLHSVARVLVPGGRLVLRVFMRPDKPASFAQLCADLRQGRIGSVHALKMRLWWVLHGSIETGVRLGDVWKLWSTLPRPAPGGPGWGEEQIASLDSYRDQDVCYFLPTLAELRAIVAPLFVERACHFGGYEGAECCPTFVLERR